MNNISWLLVIDVLVIKMQSQNIDSNQDYFQNNLNPFIKLSVWSQTF